MRITIIVGAGYSNKEMARKWLFSGSVSLAALHRLQITVAVIKPQGDQVRARKWGLVA